MNMELIQSWVIVVLPYPTDSYMIKRHQLEILLYGGKNFTNENSLREYSILHIVAFPCKPWINVWQEIRLSCQDLPWPVVRKHLCTSHIERAVQHIVPRTRTMGSEQVSWGFTVLENAWVQFTLWIDYKSSAWWLTLFMKLIPSHRWLRWRYVHSREWLVTPDGSKTVAPVAFKHEACTLE